MSVLLEVARAATVANLGLLLALGYVWAGNYRRHGATHTLALLVFAGFLLLQNALWAWLYGFDGRYVDWFVAVGWDVQLSLALLCALETAALAFLTWITWR